MTTPVAFASWRTTWAKLDGISPLLAIADERLRRRAKGNHRLPNLDSAIKGTSGIAMEALRRWTDGKLPTSLSDRPLIVRKISTGITPALHAVAWPRWLLLERALLDGSDSGDLLFSAVVIRAMCEELQKLLSLDISSEAIGLLAASENSEDARRLNLFLRLARDSLDAPKSPLDFDPESEADFTWSETAWPRLHAAKQALNDYVHPNYGSHVAALFPEHGIAARILLEGLIVAYDAFLSLSWAETPLKGKSEQLQVKAFKNWPNTVRHFTKRVLPEIQRQTDDSIKAGHLPSDVREVFGGTAIVGWLTTKDAAWVELLRDPQLALSVQSLLLPTDIRRGVGAPNETVSYHLWDGASVREIFFLAQARRIEKQLADAFPNGSPDKSQQQRWLQFIEYMLQLAVSVDRVKISAFKAQLLRQIVSGNVLGIWLCVRSLVEHTAVINWLNKRLHKLWIEIGKRAKPESGLPTQATHMAEALAKFLTGTKGSMEDMRPWTMREYHGRWAVNLRLHDIVEEGIEPTDRLRQFYAVSSSALHGRTYRGRDLLIEKVALHSASVNCGYFILERLCDPKADMDVLAPAAVLLRMIEHAISRDDNYLPESDSEAKARFSYFDGKLKPGRDYTGDGTRENPIFLKQYLEYYTASHALLQQLGVDKDDKKLLPDSSGRLCDCYQSPDREWWFVITSNSLGLDIP